MTSAVPIGVAGDESAIVSERRPWRFKLRRPTSQHGFGFGFVFRFAYAAVAVFVPIIPLMVFAPIVDWQPTNSMLIIYGVMVAITILFGEHLRSRTYERMMAGSGPEMEIEVQSDRLPSIDGTPLDASLRPSINAKRVFDVAFVLIAIGPLSPVFIIIAILIRALMGSPVLIAHQRIGYQGKPFRAYKFRTMTIGSDDPRVTSLGRLLRKSAMEELPQLINVLNGSMSLVGPPALPPHFQGRLGWLEVTKPGLTWLRDEALTPANYARKWPWYDLKAIVRTMPALMRD